MSNGVTKVESDIRESLSYWWSTLGEDTRIVKMPAMPTIAFPASAGSTALIWPGEPARIEVFQEFIGEIGDVVNSSAGALMAACLDGLEIEGGQEAEAMVKRAALDLMQSFVILHEVFHLLCGHVEEFSRRDEELNRPLDEMHFGIDNSGFDERPTMALAQDELLKAYFREVEADDCALQCLLQLPMQDALLEIVASIDTPDDSIPTQPLQLTGFAQVVAFRLVFASAWTIMWLFEARRSQEIRKASHRHPLPAARLLAALFTIMEEFAGLISTPDGRGRRSCILSETTAASSRLFLDAVLKPVFKMPWPDLPNVAELSPQIIVLDLASLMLNREPQSAAGRELSRLNGIRSEMTRRLRPYRYYELEESNE
jgi:hypothetical protein